MKEGKVGGEAGLRKDKRRVAKASIKLGSNTSKRDSATSSDASRAYRSVALRKFSFKGLKHAFSKVMQSPELDDCSDPRQVHKTRCSGATKPRLNNGSARLLKQDGGDKDEDAKYMGVRRTLGYLDPYQPCIAAQSRWMGGGGAFALPSATCQSSS